MNKRRIARIQKMKMAEGILLQAMSMMRYAFATNLMLSVVNHDKPNCHSLSASRIKTILMNQMMKMNMMIAMKMMRLTASNAHSAVLM